jgi:fluoride ion exporter CrcB/FEX
VWRCRRETLRDERRGTQLKVSLGDDDDDADLERTISETIGDGSVGALVLAKRRKKRPKNDGGRILDEEAITRSIPSIRALVTAISCTILIGFISSLVFYAHDDAIVSTSWSLLFSPMGGFARRTLTMNYNNYFQSFPLGSFACNMLGCALSGGLGAIIAGNPDPGQHIALLSSISGFAGSLSAFTSFLIEVLERIDPILLNSDGVLYALWTIFS